MLEDLEFRSQTRQRKWWPRFYLKNAIVFPLLAVCWIWCRGWVPTDLLVQFLSMVFLQKEPCKTEQTCQISSSESKPCLHAGKKGLAHHAKILTALSMTPKCWRDTNKQQSSSLSSSHCVSTHVLTKQAARYTDLYHRLDIEHIDLERRSCHWGWSRWLRIARFDWEALNRSLSPVSPDLGLDEPI